MGSYPPQGFGDPALRKQVEELRKSNQKWQWISLGLTAYSAIITTIAIYLSM